jgi:predicted dehydrogenase
VAAAEAGRHVIVEKPIEITLPRVDAVIRAADRAGVKLATVFPERFNPASQALKRAVEAGRFGRLVLGDCYNKWWRSQDYYDSGGWRGTWRLDGGGACMNQAVHAIDLLQWMMGPVERVPADPDRLAHVRIEVEDTAAALLRFRNGALGVIEAATSVYPGLKRRLEIHGDRGSVVYENENIVLWGFAEKRPSDARLRRRLAPLPDGESYGVSDPRNITHFGHAEVFRDMVRAVRTGGPVACGGREGRKAVEIILAIYRSARTKKTVRLPLKG